MINLMSVRVQNSPKRSPDQISALAMPHIAMNCPTWWNSNEQQMQQCLSKNLGFKVDSSPQLCQESKHLGLQLPDQESSSNQSYGQSHHDVGAMAGATSQDQCISTESGEGEKCGKDVGGQIKPMFLLNSPDNVFSLPQIDHNHAMVQAHHPNPYVDPHIGPLFTCGLQTMMIGNGIAPARVPLPLDLAEDGHIYVNAKQYHGILRRRQSRAKLDAQNKLIKSRKPYLHESRHLHAVKRVRGSGGRFLSTKKVQENKDESELNSPSSISGTMTSCSDITSVCVNNNNSFIFQQLDLLCSGSGASAASSIA